jgi:RHS repeat-associated protein
MKRIFTSFVFILLIDFVYSQSIDFNYIHLIKPKTSQKTSAQINNPILSTESINYFDGFGRPLQSINKQQSPSQQDIISFKQYDGFGREQTIYLPFTANQSNANLIPNPIAIQSTFYNTPQNGIKQNIAPYVKTKFENSPLNRVIEQGHSGPEFQVGNSTGTIKTNIRFNIETDNILMWNINKDNMPEIIRGYESEVVGNSECLTSFANFPCNSTYNATQVVLSSFLGQPRQGSVSDLCFAFYYNGTANSTSQNTFKLSNFITTGQYCKVSFYLLKPNINSNTKLFVRDLNTSKIIYSINDISSSSYVQYVFTYKSNGNVNVQFEVADGNWGASSVINSDIVILDDIVLKEVSSVNTGPIKYYEPNTLQIVENIDENGSKVETFSDIFGKTILKRSKLNAVWLETYYVYNNNELLQAVIPPEAVKLLSSNNYDLVQNRLYDKYIFNTIFDERKRPVIKKTPGKGVEYFVYNIKNQLVLKQDGKLRSENPSSWMFYKYDELGRDIYSGITTFQNNYSRSQLQEIINNYIINEQLSEVKTSNGYLYTNRAFPTSLESEIFSINYYDSYPTLTIATNITTQTTYNSRITGLPTRTLYKLINTDGSINNSKWYSKYIYYDSKARIIYTIDEHDGVVEKKSNSFDFEDNLLSTNSILETPNGINIISKSYTYDHANRLLSISQKINDEPTVVLSNYIYNDLGTLYKKNYNIVNGNPLFSGDLSYTENNWVDKIEYYWSQNRQECNQVQLFDVNDLKTLINGSDSDIELYYQSNIVDWANHKAANFISLLDQFGFPEEKYPEVYISEIKEVGGNPKQIFEDQIRTLLYTNLINNNIDISSTPIDETNSLIQSVLDQILIKNISPALVYNECFTVTDRFNLFNEQLFYESPSVNNINGSQFNGNISSVRWQTTNLPINEYSYLYDNINRLIDADYYEKVNNQWTASIKYDVSNLNYDFNGNILNMKQKGVVSQNSSGSTYGLVDDLNYTYDGNNLKSVVDLIADGTNQRNDFSNGSTIDAIGASSTIDYTYDANGNMLSDLNKGITITYNYMNLPSKVVFSNGNKIEYVYDPFGIKRKQLISTYNSTSNTYSTITKVYVGSALYENGNIAYISNEEGVFQKSASIFVMQYSLKDHLGNLRMSLKADVNNEPIILQYDSYYPFGLEMGGLSYVSSNENKYKYNGKEKQDAFNLGWYDYGARFYDPQIGRWLSLDPLAVEFPSWSPYNYCENNPILMIDPTGLYADSYFNLAGDNLGVDKDGANGVTRIVSNQEWNSITSKNNSTSEEGTKLLRQTSSKNPILFDNENVAYNYLDKNSKNANGSWDVENAAWLTTGGVVALPTTGNTSNEATLFGAKKSGNSGRYSFRFANRALGIKGSIHTHPPESVKTDQWDIDASKYGPTFIMNNDKVWLNFYHGGYTNPKGLVSSGLINTKTLLNDKRYSLIKYTDKAYWNQYYK